MFSLKQPKKEKYCISLINTLVGKKYSIDKKIGLGRYSNVYRAVNIQDNK